VPAESSVAVAEPGVEPGQPNIGHRNYPDAARAEPGQVIIMPTGEGD
jgi:hypothetical protein